MGNIIKGNFGTGIDNAQKTANSTQDMPDELLNFTPEEPSESEQENPKDVCLDLARVRMNGLKVRLTKAPTGLFVVSVYKLGELTATYRRTDDFDKAWAVFSEIAKHIKDETRSYEELTLILNNKIE